MEESSKKSSKTLWVVIVLILLVAGLAFVLIAMAINRNNSTTSSTATTQPSDSMDMSSSQSDDTADTTEAIETDEVEIENFAFKQPSIKVKVGTTVTWTNKDSVEHTVTADTASSDAPSSPLFGDGKTYTFTFNKAGTYAYHCNPHPYMKGTVVVTE